MRDGKISTEEYQKLKGVDIRESTRLRLRISAASR